MRVESSTPKCVAPRAACTGSACRSQTRYRNAWRSRSHAAGSSMRSPTCGESPRPASRSSERSRTGAAPRSVSSRTPRSSAPKRHSIRSACSRCRAPRPIFSAASDRKLGKVANRRGTKVRFKPDPEIFGAKATFNPQRLFKMSRAKAYLFGGVEIRWSCAKELLDGIDDVPPEATFHFAKGLEDYLKATINGQTLVHPDIFAGKSEKSGGQ